MYWRPGARLHSMVCSTPKYSTRAGQKDVCGRANARVARGTARNGCTGMWPTVLNRGHHSAPVLWCTAATSEYAVYTPYAARMGTNRAPAPSKGSRRRRASATACGCAASGGQHHACAAPAGGPPTGRRRGHTHRSQPHAVAKQDGGKVGVHGAGPPEVPPMLSKPSASLPRPRPPPAPCPRLAGLTPPHPVCCVCGATGSWGSSKQAGHGRAGEP